MQFFFWAACQHVTTSQTKKSDLIRNFQVNKNTKYTNITHKHIHEIYITHTKYSLKIYIIKKKVSRGSLYPRRHSTSSKIPLFVPRSVLPR